MIEVENPTWAPPGDYLPVTREWFDRAANWTLKNQRWLLPATASGLIGAFLGFLLRPRAPLVGQLPFWTVVTRGSSLEGLDQILVPAARQSFNYMLVGAIVGTLAAVVFTKVLANRSA